MNREAAALGVPVYSIFRGKIGAVDRYLVERNRLVLLETVDDVRRKIKAVRRAESKSHAGITSTPALETIILNIVSILESTKPVLTKDNADLGTIDMTAGTAESALLTREKVAASRQ